MTEVAQAGALKEFTSKELIAELEERGDTPPGNLDDFGDDEIEGEYEHRCLGDPEDDAALQDVGALDVAVSNARWGNKDECLVQLMRAVPTLWPLTKLIG